jgi:hypothetical protein
LYLTLHINMSKTLERYRKLFPNDTRSDWRIALEHGQLDEGKVDRSLDPEFEAEFQKAKDIFRPGFFENIGEGVARGVDMSQAIAYGASAWGAEALGADSVRDWAIDGVTENLKEAAKNKAFIGSVSDIESGADFATWAVGGLSELVPDVLATIGITAVSGGLATLPAVSSRAAASKLVGDQLLKKFGKEALNKMGKEAIEKETQILTRGLVEDLTKKGVKEKVAEKTVQELGEAAVKADRLRRGAQIGATVSGIQQGIGESYMGFATDMDNPNVSKSERILAPLVAGTLSGILDTALPLIAINKALPPAAKEGMKASILEKFTDFAKANPKKAALLAMGGGSVAEGTTEALQSLIGYTAQTVADEGKDWKWEDIKPELIDAAALGALGGAGFGAAGTASTLLMDDKADVKRKEQNDKKEAVLKMRQEEAGIDPQQAAQQRAAPPTSYQTLVNAMNREEATNLASKPDITEEDRIKINELLKEVDDPTVERDVNLLLKTSDTNRLAELKEKIKKNTLSDQDVKDVNRLIVLYPIEAQDLNGISSQYSPAPAPATEEMNRYFILQESAYLEPAQRRELSELSRKAASGVNPKLTAVDLEIKTLTNLINREARGENYRPTRLTDYPL